MRFVSWAAPLGAAAAIAACGQGFTAGGASGGGDAGPDVANTGDDEVDTGTGSSSGSGSSGGNGEAGPPHEASVSDGPSLSEGGNGDWCSDPQHVGSAKFCEDFDENTLITGFLAPPWTYSENGASFSFDHLGVPSPPNALEVTTSSTSQVNTLVVRSMPASVTSPTTQRLEFDLRIDQASGIGVTAAAAVAAILYGDTVDSGAVALAFGNGPTLSAVYLQAPDAGLPGFGSADATGAFPTLGQWDGRFAIEITFNAGGSGTSGACAQVYVGAAPQLSPCLKLPSSLSHPAQASIALGVYSGGIGSTGTIGLRYDDVTYTEQ
ncbi:MAG TPA: hypothetical protein VGG39_18980 [Polyangiaceae bacterium]|jgi:hypothetical protein